MSNQLNGHSSLNINNVPGEKKPKIGLIEHSIPKMKTFRLSKEAIDALEDTTKRFAYEAKIKLSMSKVLELAIFYIETKTLTEIIN